VSIVDVVVEIDCSLGVELVVGQLSPHVVAEQSQVLQCLGQDFRVEICRYDPTYSIEYSRRGALYLHSYMA
jgi:hypothetical protein